MPRILGGLLPAAVLVLLVGCTTSSNAVDPAHAPTDVTFAQEMIPHHQQAVAMAQLADTRAAAPAVRTLAARIDGEQAPEIDRMTAMLAAWAAPVPAASTGTSGMSGMMSPQDMAGLGALSGPAFDRAFLTMMIAHHTGAVQMAQTELGGGTNPRARELAQSIVGAQQGEIAEMQRLLGA